MHRDMAYNDLEADALRNREECLPCSLAPRHSGPALARRDISPWLRLTLTAAWKDMLVWLTSLVRAWGGGWRGSIGWVGVSGAAGSRTALRVGGDHGWSREGIPIVAGLRLYGIVLGL